MNGIDLLRSVRERRPRARRAMLSAQADQDPVDRSLSDGLLHAAFTKPWGKGDLVEALEAAVAPVA